MRTLREVNRRCDEEHERIFRETGVPNPMLKGEIGATKYAYPNGMLHERIGRWIARQAWHVLRRGASRPS